MVEERMQDACRVLGKLGSDEQFRVAFAKDPVAAMRKEGFKLTDKDVKLLGTIDLCKYNMLMREGLAESSCTGYCNVG